jgi:hypothetical protein
VQGFVATARPAVVRIWQGPGGEPQEQGTRQVVGGTLRPVRRLTEHQTRFLQAHAPGPVKMTLPSPNQFPAISFQPVSPSRFIRRALTCYRPSLPLSNGRSLPWSRTAFHTSR